MKFHDYVAFIGGLQHQVAAAKEIDTAPPCSKFLLYGRMGAGKTWLALALAKHRLLEGAGSVTMNGFARESVDDVAAAAGGGARLGVSPEGVYDWEWLGDRPQALMVLRFSRHPDFGCPAGDRIRAFAPKAEVFAVARTPLPGIRYAVSAVCGGGVIEINLSTFEPMNEGLPASIKSPLTPPRI